MVVGQICEIVGIGNAIVDVISTETDDFVDRFGLVKGSMELIDAERATALYDSMAIVAETSGGSACNTMAGVGSFGAGAAFIGKVGDDQLGRVFREDSANAGVVFEVAPSHEGKPTGRSMIVVTPDGERTMSTFLGAATTLYPKDVDLSMIANASVLYCEGYIWDINVTKNTIRQALSKAKASKTAVSFTLSDSFCVERHFDEWHYLVDNDIDILFGNEQELMTLTKTSTLEAAIEAVRGRCPILAATRSERGSIIVTSDETIEVEAVAVDEIVDTTGAGDQYAAGFLYGYSQGFELAACGRLGSLAAAEVIGHMGARPSISLQSLVGK